LPVFLVHWEKSEPAPAPAPPEAPAAAAAPVRELFVLDVQVGAKGLRVMAMDGAGDNGTVKAYADVPLSLPRLDELAARFGTFMRAGGTASYLDRVKQQGQELFGLALSERARKRLGETKVESLRLHLDDQLVHVPWELLHDGQQFLALRFSMGRVVNARAETAPGLRLPADCGGHALVVSDPSGDLPAATREGEAVEGLLKDAYAGQVRHVRGPLTRQQLCAELRGCELLHFAGHAERPGATSPGGFRLADGLLTPEALAEAVGTSAPALVFANSCHSSSGAGFRSEEGGADLASALLLRGTRHFVGPRWDIEDEDALGFALRFYEHALAGGACGDAVLRARQSLRGPEHRPLSFAGYVLYGEPRELLPGARAVKAPPRATRSASTERVPATAFAARPAAAPASRRKLALGAAAVAAVAALAVGYALARGGPRGAAPEEPVAEQEAPGRPGGPPRTAASARTGPVRLSMLEFKNISRDAELDFLTDGLTESMITDFGEHPGVRLIERAQIELDLKELEFSQSRYVDPGARAELGKIVGAEVVVLGGFQRVGRTMRARARFVDVETGEVLHALWVERALTDGDDAALFELQNKLSDEVRNAVPALLARARPGSPAP
jgi:TolB-like protein